MHREIEAKVRRALKREVKVGNHRTLGETLRAFGATDEFREAKEAGFDLCFDLRALGGRPERKRCRGKPVSGDAAQHRIGVEVSLSPPIEGGAREVAATSIENMSDLVGVAAKSGHVLGDVVNLASALQRGMTGAENDTGRVETALKALGEYEDGASQPTLATMLFGRAGVQAIPILNDLAEAALVPSLDEYAPAFAATAVEFRRAADSGFGFVDALAMVAGDAAGQQAGVESVDQEKRHG